MRNREVVHIMPVKITETVWIDGKRLTTFLDSILLARLQNGLSTGSVIETARLCHLKSLPTDSLQKAYPLVVKRFTFTLTPPKTQLSGKEYEVWDACRYNIEHHVAIDPNVQRDGEEELIYTHPILLSHATCLNCHGMIGKELTQSNFQGLKKRYPAMDSLVGYTAGQTIGLWSFRFTKAAVVRQITGTQK